MQGQQTLKKSCPIII